MTSRQRLLGLLSGLGHDGLAWTTLVDDTTRSVMEPAVRALPVLDFYRHIGCDILQFGNYALPAELCLPAACRFEKPGQDQHSRANGVSRHLRQTPWGDLEGTWEGGHPVKYPVATLPELRILRQLWEATTCVPNDNLPQVHARIEQALGEDGLFLPTTWPSPVQALLEFEMGPENFYFLLADHPAEFAGLLAAMHACRCREYELLAANCPAAGVIPVENTSSTLISPELYRRYSLPQIRDYVDIMHAAGKKVILHMCGHLKALLPVIKETGLDGINAATPPPVGSTRYEDVLEVLGEDFLILGGILDPTVFQDANLTPAKLQAFLDELYTPRLRRANLLLWLGADGLPTPLERFTAVRQWMERSGGR